MVRFQPDLHASNSARPSSSPSSLRNHPNGRIPRPSQHQRTASANTRDLLHRVQNGGQPQHLQTLRSASSSSLSGLEYAAGASSSPQRNHRFYISSSAQHVEPLTLRQFASREISVVLLWKAASFFAYSVLLWPRQRNHILATSVPYFLTMVQRRTSVLPFWPARVAEYAMGRLSKQEITTSLSIHAVIFASSLLLVATVFPGRLVETTAQEQESQGHDFWNDAPSISWIFLRFMPKYIRETVSTAIFVMSLLVLPTALDLNRFPPWSMMLLYYPWGSGLLQRWLPAPAASYFVVSLHWASEATGAILAGELMDLYFPDDSQRKSSLLDRA